MCKIEVQTIIYDCPFCEFVDDSDLEMMDHIIFTHRKLAQKAMYRNMQKHMIEHEEREMP